MKILYSIWVICFVSISLGFIVSCVEEFDDNEGDFTGTYNVTDTESISGKSSQITDTITISKDIMGDLSIKTQNFGVLKATITSKQSFRIEKQDAIVKTSSGKTKVTIQGKGTVSAGFLDISGSYSLLDQVVTFHLSGSRI